VSSFQVQKATRKKKEEERKCKFPKRAWFLFFSVLFREQYCRYHWLSRIQKKRLNQSARGRQASVKFCKIRVMQWYYCTGGGGALLHIKTVVKPVMFSGCLISFPFFRAVIAL